MFTIDWLDWHRHTTIFISMQCNAMGITEAGRGPLFPAHSETRKLCCRKETARCRSCSFRFADDIHYKFKKRSFESQASKLQTYGAKQNLPQNMAIQGHSSSGGSTLGPGGTGPPNLAQPPPPQFLDTVVLLLVELIGSI